MMNCGEQVMMNCDGQVTMNCDGQVAVSQNARGFFAGKRWTAAAPRELTLGARKCQLGIPNQELATVMVKNVRIKRFFIVKRFYG